MGEKARIGLGESGVISMGETEFLYGVKWGIVIDLSVGSGVEYRVVMIAFYRCNV